jgi:hypothetical protein
MLYIKSEFTPNYKNVLPYVTCVLELGVIFLIEPVYLCDGRHVPTQSAFHNCLFIRNYVKIV